jgi:hypothetical protein
MNFLYTFVFCPIAVKPRLELLHWIARGRERQRQKAVASEERERRRAGYGRVAFAEDDRMLHFMYGVRVLALGLFSCSTLLVCFGRRGVRVSGSADRTELRCR